MKGGNPTNLCRHSGVEVPTCSSAQEANQTPIVIYCNSEPGVVPVVDLSIVPGTCTSRETTSPRAAAAATSADTQSTLRETFDRDTQFKSGSAKANSLKQIFGVRHQSP